MIGRLAWILALALLAAISVVAQVDRRARYDAALSGFVPAAYGGFAAEQRARNALLQQDGERALVESRLLLRTRPIPADHLSLLALAEALAGDEARATAALEAAARRGWRDPLPQLASAQAALETGAHDVAAQRITALLATGELREQASPLYARLLETPEGRAAMARRYAATGYWQSNSLGHVGGSADPGDLADTLARAQDLGAALPCDRLQALADSLSRQGKANIAARFWPGDCPVS